MTVKKNQVLQPKNKARKPIVYNVYYKDSEQPLQVVIFAHGYKGFKDWGPWHLVAEAFANAGFCFIKFNFSHNGGTVEQPIDFPDLEAFAQNNYSIELDDLKRVIDYFETENGKSLPSVSTISLIGHSRGGGVCLIKAEEDSRIDKVIGWASVCDFVPRFRPDTEDFQDWKKTGITYIENTRTKQNLPHYYQFYEDFKTNEERFTIRRAVKSLKKPLLIIQGDADTSVVPAEAQALHCWSKNSVLKMLPNADHVFGGSHPWTEKTLPIDLKTVVKTTIDFIKQPIVLKKSLFLPT